MDSIETVEKEVCENWLFRQSLRLQLCVIYGPIALLGGLAFVVVHFTPNLFG